MTLFDATLAILWLGWFGSVQHSHTDNVNDNLNNHNNWKLYYPFLTSDPHIVGGIIWNNIEEPTQT